MSLCGGTCYMLPVHCSLSSHNRPIQRATHTRLHSYYMRSHDLNPGLLAPESLFFSAELHWDMGFSLSTLQGSRQCHLVSFWQFLVSWDLVYLTSGLSPRAILEGLGSEELLLVPP